MLLLAWQPAALSGVEGTFEPGSSSAAFAPENSKP
jgi:hypothetical protein